MIDLNKMIEEARARIHAAIDYRYSLAVRGTVNLQTYHRRCLAQRYRRGTIGSKQA